ncbi:MAG: sigma-54-dependent Fis family transcriptional regulator [Bacteroidaceae bacterium]|nr:sigma-54-dependent Fis family transcriptional regulator [Bacteroidaceae bacterium]
METSALQDIKQRYRIVGRDEKLDMALNTALQVASTDLSVLIQGESGVGKEIIPRIIHDASLRRTGRYIAINCGSIPEGTIDSELFGHEKGSYTGAIDEREGYFGAADGGTLFLDEIGELPITTQARLLRVLETGEYIRVGSDTPSKTNVRIVAATNVDLPAAIRDGRFREDLYYRLCTINIQMPPLRDRGIDSVLLFKMFAMETARKYRIPESVRLTEEAEKVVMAYKWPGNVRQLRNVVEQISILERGSVRITPQVLERYGITAGGGESFAMARIGKSGSEGGRHDWENQIKFLLNAVMQLRSEVEQLKNVAFGTQDDKPIHQPTLQLESKSLVPHFESPDLTDTGVPTVHIPDYDDAEDVTEEETLNIEEMEKRMIVRALQKSHNRRKVAAQLLGISERTLYRKINDYGIEE